MLWSGLKEYFKWLRQNGFRKEYHTPCLTEQHFTIEICHVGVCGMIVVFSVYICFLSWASWATTAHPPKLFTNHIHLFLFTEQTKPEIKSWYRKVNRKKANSMSVLCIYKDNCVDKKNIKHLISVSVLSTGCSTLVASITLCCIVRLFCPSWAVLSGALKWMALSVLPTRWR